MFRFVDALNEVSPESWNAVLQTDYPFLKHEFLNSLELSGACGGRTGWLPRHLLIEEDGQLIGHLPLYMKYHSYGEYVFDWSWANAYERHGNSYYPKLLSAIPYTPATGPRLSLLPSYDTDGLRKRIGEFLLDYCESEASSLHILYPEKTDDTSMADWGMSQRTQPQYHWFNRNYDSFDDFLETFASRKRKGLRRERRLVGDQGITLRRIEGEQIDEEQWMHFYHCYQMTYAKRSGHGGYLNEAFFRAIGRLMPEHLLMVVAEKKGRPIAAALNFRDSKSLYGRYWGCIAEYECLHFEACYYQGIEYCIEKKLQRFDPGAQGEHKIQRGFEPTRTLSRHWIVDERFRQAIDNFLDEEAKHIDRYLVDARGMLPFKQS